METQEIVANNQNISLENVDQGKNQFCTIWPQAKTGLELLQGLVKNPIAKAAIGIVIAAGDAVSKTICGNSEV